MKTVAIALPVELVAALRKDAAARAAYEGMPRSHRAEHVKWIGEAKKAQTRARRVAKAVGMMRAWAERAGRRKG